MQGFLAVDLGVGESGDRLASVGRTAIVCDLGQVASVDVVRFSRSIVATFEVGVGSDFGFGFGSDFGSGFGSGSGFVGNIPNV